MIDAKKQEVIRAAEELYACKPDWVTFFRNILGVDGIVRRLFLDPEELAEFRKSSEFKTLQQMVAQLRADSHSESAVEEPTRVITVRLPRSMHESLRAEAHTHQTSMNKLCISKLLQLVDDSLVPSD